MLVKFAGNHQGHVLRPVCGAEESLRAAAAAAAKRAAANLTTYFADDIEPAPSSAVNGGAVCVFKGQIFAFLPVRGSRKDTT